MNTVLKYTLIASIIMCGSVSTYAQCDIANDRCVEYLEQEFISDGQNYRALLVEDEVAEFTTTFYAGVQYRIAACSGDSDGILEFRVYDQNRTLLFDNSDYETSPYWNFVSENNMDCIIEASLNTEKAESGCAVILLGFKN